MPFDAHADDDDRAQRDPAASKRDLKLVEGLDGLQSQEAHWRSAEKAGHLASAFERYDMARACAEAAGAAGSTVITAVFGDGSDTRTIIPLRTEQHAGICKAIPLTAPISQYTSSIGTALTRSELEKLAISLSEHFRVDLLLLRRVRPEHALFGALSAKAAAGAPETALFIDLSAWGSFDAYDRSFSGSTRRNRRQRRQKLEAEVGSVEFEVLTWSQAEAPLRAAIGWKSRWLQEYGFRSPVLDKGLWQNALTACAKQEGAYLSVMKAGGELAAVELGFAYRGEYIAYLGAFNPALSRFSVGQEQMVRTIAWCFEQTFSRYALLAPDDPYKRFWTRDNGGEDVIDFTLPTSFKGHAYAFVHRRGRPLAKRLIHALPTPIRRALVHTVS